MSTPRATFRSATFSGYATGVLDLEVAGRRVLSVPTQLGCTVGCTFCISRTRPLVRNLQATEMLVLVDSCLGAVPANGAPVEISFTGEGEPLLNWKQAESVVRELAARGAAQTARYCLSGLGAHKLLPRLNANILPTRLQVSLHAARQEVRDTLVPNSIPLALLEKTLLAEAHRFAGVELNVVLQDGVNDADDDLDALVAWGDVSWPILLNPQLTESSAKVAMRTQHFADELRRAGRTVRVYRELAQQIVRNGLYSQMSAKPVYFMRSAATKATALDLALSPT
jgi:adenine C2-methylase RlmN of 23S rRNA A2503 and tRNA A37